MKKCLFSLMKRFNWKTYILGKRKKKKKRKEKRKGGETKIGASEGRVEKNEFLGDGW